ncbi:hypothetical protein [Thiomicrorhabdus xiamenensis]|uniref:Uncharacterized protein n=1 Tax=Thiomicrorhabdus xiamenensis TaxID=2739063 RepID=A0A7D4T028_9GAMM|nr:hypothetical protein [Thiomicrorhabdus xiamenensis]QKI88962.1 hypothetical protein HQN79_04940 [Thiomicrorhabdus xiamenensis]
MKLDNPKSVKSAVEIMEQFNLNPLEELARLTVEAKARGDDLTVESISKFLMPYMYPKQKHVSMEVTDTVAAKEWSERINRGRDRLAKKGLVIEHESALDHESEISFL